MADLKISELTETNSATTGDYFIINKGDATTQKIDVSNLRGAIGGNRVYMVNFPNMGGFSFDPTSTKQYNGSATENSEVGNFINTTDLYDVFDSASNTIKLVMPAGCDAAVVIATYSCGISFSKNVNTDGSDFGHASFGYEVQCATNKTTVTWAPGGNNKFAFGTKLYGKVSNTLDSSVPSSRVPANSSNPSRAMRVYFDESTESAPTELTFSVLGIIHRMRKCTASMGSGKIVVIPYKDDGSDPFSKDGFSPFAFDYDEEEMDDGGELPAAFYENMYSRELKDRMNRMATAIQETKDYDPNLPASDATHADIKAYLAEQLAEIFRLKQLPASDYQAVEASLDLIRENVLPYVGFKFGFEVSGFTTPSF